MERCEYRFQQSKMVHSIMRHVAEKRLTPLEKLYEMVAWPLYRKYGHALEAFKTIVIEGDELLDKMCLELGLKVPLDVRKELLICLQKRLATQKIKYRADLEVICSGYEGVLCIKDALLAGLAVGCSNGTGTAGTTNALDIRLVAPPLYIMTTEALDKNAAIGLMEKAISKIEEHLGPRQGHLTVKVRPRAVNESDDKELKMLMEKEERENAQVSGDEELSDMDGE
jgi:translation initiation factor 2 subunit 1